MEFSHQHCEQTEAEALPTLLLEAIGYLRLFYQEQSLPESQSQERFSEIHQECQRAALQIPQGLRTYWQIKDELIHGAKVA